MVVEALLDWAPQYQSIVAGPSSIVLGSGRSRKEPIASPRVARGSDVVNRTVAAMHSSLMKLQTMTMMRRPELAFTAHLSGYI